MLRVVCFSGLVVATGCVTHGKYDQLQRQLDDTSARLQNERTQAEKLADANARMKKVNADLQQSVEKMSADLAEAEARKAAAHQRVAEYQDLVRRFEKLIDAGKVNVAIVDGRMVVQLPEKVLFPTAKAKLSKSGKETIHQVTQVLAALPDRSFEVEGHTDARPIDNWRYPSNWELGAERAINVVRAMNEFGMPPERLTAASRSKYQPAATNATSEGMAENRRIEIVVLPDLSQLPGAEQLAQMGQTQN